MKTKPSKTISYKKLCRRRKKRILLKDSMRFKHPVRYKELDINQKINTRSNTAEYYRDNEKILGNNIFAFVRFYDQIGSLVSPAFFTEP